MNNLAKCRAKNPSTCPMHGIVVDEQKEKFMNTFVPANINKLSHLTTEEKFFLMEKLHDVNKYSSKYEHSYEDEPSPATREGEMEFLVGYAASKYAANPEIVSQTADNIILTKGEDGQLKILLIERGDHPYKGFWCHPGGFVDGEETAQEAAVRELHEETNMTISHDMLHFVKRYSHNWRDPRMKHIEMNTHVTYLPVIPKFEAGDDAFAAKLVDLKSLYTDKPEVQLGFDHKKSIADSISFLMLRK